MSGDGDERRRTIVRGHVGPRRIGPHFIGAAGRRGAVFRLLQPARIVPHAPVLPGPAVAAGLDSVVSDLSGGKRRRADAGAVGQREGGRVHRLRGPDGHGGHDRQRDRIAVASARVRPGGVSAHLVGARGGRPDGGGLRCPAGAVPDHPVLPRAAGGPAFETVVNRLARDARRRGGQCGVTGRDARPRQRQRTQGHRRGGRHHHGARLHAAEIGHAILHRGEAIDESAGDGRKGQRERRVRRGPRRRPVHRGIVLGRAVGIEQFQKEGGIPRRGPGVGDVGGKPDRLARHPGGWKVDAVPSNPVRSVQRPRKRPADQRRE